MKIMMKDIRGITWWVYWRSLLLGMIGSVILGALVGFIAGLLLGLFGYGQYGGQVGAALGFVAGLFSMFVALNWALANVIGKNISGKVLNLDQSNSS